MSDKPSPTLAAYLALDHTVDQLHDLMDPLWHKLSGEDREHLNSRSKPKPQPEARDATPAKMEANLAALRRYRQRDQKKIDNYEERIEKLEGELATLRERLTCAEVICQQTQKIDDERQSFKAKLREAETKRDMLQGMIEVWKAEEIMWHEQEETDAKRIKELEVELQRYRDVGTVLGAENVASLAFKVGETIGENLKFQQLANEAAAWRKRYGMHTGGIIDRVADLGDPDKVPKPMEEA